MDLSKIINTISEPVDVSALIHTDFPSATLYAGASRRPDGKRWSKRNISAANSTLGPDPQSEVIVDKKRKVEVSCAAPVFGEWSRRGADCAHNSVDYCCRLRQTQRLGGTRRPDVRIPGLSYVDDKGSDCLGRAAPSVIHPHCVEYKLTAPGYHRCHLQDRFIRS